MNKILILTNDTTGLYVFRKEVVKKMVDEGYQVFASVPYDSPKADFFREMGCDIIITKFNRKGTNPLKDLGLLRKYYGLIRQIKPNVVLTYTIKPNLYGGLACRLCGVPQIANITGLGSAVENAGWLQKLTIFLYKVCMRKTHTVFFQNKANKIFCEKHNMVKGNVILLPGSGVNLQYHTFKKYPSPEEPIKFIFISRLMREKGIEEYLCAAEQIKSKHPSSEFHILGSYEESYKERLQSLQEKGVVVYHGFQSDVRPFIESIHCTVHPSFYPEGMSNVLLESCAAGRPIITTDRPGCGEIVDEGQNGFIVKAKDSKDLTNIIERFINLPYEQKVVMGQKARKKVEQEFDRKVVIDAYLNQIKQIVNV